jgi:signal transduction histidine kinase
LQLILGTWIAAGNWKIASEVTSQPLKTRQLLKQQLVNIHNLNEMSKVLLGMAHTFMPLVGATFVKYDQKSERYELIDKWSVDGRTLPVPTPLPTLKKPSLKFIDQGSAQGFFIPGKCSDRAQTAEQLSIFFLTRPDGDDQTALLSLFFPPEASFTQLQLALLNEIALEAELAIERDQLRIMLSSQDAMKKVEHERISRYLHDTLGHNLAYLRLKLDQLSGDDALQDIYAIQQEIERMRDIADLAYEQMRKSLSDLREEPIPEFATAVQEYVNSIGDQSGLEVLLLTEGEARLLPDQLQRQILYILREVMRNVEKHAQASKVWLRIVWEKENLTIVVRDDGRGFDVNGAHKQSGHLGLKIIEECTEELHGRFVLSSKQHQGTQVYLSFPLDHHVRSTRGSVESFNRG